MTYFLFFLSIGLITVLALVIKKLQHQKLGTSIALQKLKEADKTIKSFEQIRNDLLERDELVRQLKCQITALQENKSEEIYLTLQKLKEADQKNKDSEQVHNDLAERDELIRKLNSKIEALQDEQNRLHQLNEEKENTIIKLYDDIEKAIEEETNEYKEKIKALEDINVPLKDENQNKDIDQFSEQKNFINIKVLEHDLYPKEIIGILIDVLKNSLNNVHENSRRQHIIADIICNNYSSSFREEFKTEIQNLFRDYRRMNPRMRQALKRMGFEIISENNNYKIIFHRDSRYVICFAKTPSDRHAGQNIARDICNLIL